MDNKTNIKVCLLGDSNTGKTSLINRVLSKTFYDTYTSTQDLGIHTLDMHIQDREVVLKVWDGQQYKRSFYNNAKAFIIFFDITMKSAFANCDKWVKIATVMSPSAHVVLVATKTDLNPSVCRKELSKFLEKWRNRISISFFFTSSKTGKNIKKPFYDIAETVLG